MTSFRKIVKQTGRKYSVRVKKKRKRTIIAKMRCKKATLATRLCFSRAARSRRLAEYRIERYNVERSLLNDWQIHKLEVNFDEVVTDFDSDDEGDSRRG